MDYTNELVDYSTMSSEEIDTCSVLTAANILGKKWVVYILCELLADYEMYFTDLQNHILNKSGENISAKVLSNALKQLEEVGILSRQIDPETRRVRYSLTEKGRDLEIILAMFKGWSIKWDREKYKKCETFTCVHDAVPIMDIDHAREFCPLIESENKEKKRSGPPHHTGSR